MAGSVPIWRGMMEDKLSIIANQFSQSSPLVYRHDSQDYKSGEGTIWIVHHMCTYIVHEQ